MEILLLMSTMSPSLLREYGGFIEMLVEDYHSLSFTTVAKIVHTVKGYTLS